MVRVSLLTMSNLKVFEVLVLLVCSAMADETNQPQTACCSLGKRGLLVMSFLWLSPEHVSVLLSPYSPAPLSYEASCHCSVQCVLFPRLC